MISGLVKALREIGSGATGYLDRDTELAAMARDALESAGIPLKPVNTNHVVMDGSTFCCMHCGGRYTLNLPAPILVMAAACDAYAHTHAGCNPENRA